MSVHVFCELLMMLGFFLVLFLLPALHSSSSFQIVSSSFLNTYRILLGFSSSPSELEHSTSLPLEHGLHHAAGVSFEKGCYLGQELTARTYHQGVIRKKVWPIIIAQTPSSSLKRVAHLHDLMPLSPISSSQLADKDPLSQLQTYFPFFDPKAIAIPTETPIVRAPIDTTASPTPVTPPKEVSRLLSTSHNLGLAMLRTEHVEDATHALRLNLDGQQTIEVVPYQPPWWKSNQTEAEEQK